MNVVEELASTSTQSSHCADVSFTVAATFRSLKTLRKQAWERVLVLVLKTVPKLVLKLVPELEQVLVWERKRVWEVQAQKLVEVQMQKQKQVWKQVWKQVSDVRKEGWKQLWGEVWELTQKSARERSNTHGEVDHDPSSNSLSHNAANRFEYEYNHPHSESHHDHYYALDDTQDSGTMFSRNSGVSISGGQFNNVSGDQVNIASTGS